MDTSFEFDEKIHACIVHFASNMCQEESNDLLDDLKNNDKIKAYSNFIVIIPEDFQACEDFRLKIHRYIVAMRKRNPKFKIAVVTNNNDTVIGYERFAKIVTQMVDKEQIFDSMEKAVAWITQSL